MTHKPETEFDVSVSGFTEKLEQRIEELLERWKLITADDDRMVSLYASELIHAWEERHAIAEHCISRGRECRRGRQSCP
jgi:secreted Zn-dependent insulinase-like peptidase